MADRPPAMRRGPLATRSPVSIGLSPPITRFVFRGSAEAARLCGTAFGCALPVETCRARRDGGRAALWLGPDEWLLLDLDAGDPGQLAAKVAAAIAPTPHALVDVSHRQVGVEVDGVLTPALLNTGCPPDLHEEAFPIGMSTRTVLAKADVVLWRQADERFHLEVNRSFAPYLVAFLRTANDGLT